MRGQDAEGYVQGCQLSIPVRGPRLVKSLPRRQTLRELGTLQPGTHLLATVPQPVWAHLTGESSFRRMLSSSVLTDQGFCFRKPWRERFFRCFRWHSAQHGCLWSFTRRAPTVTPGNLELATPGKAATGSPPWQRQVPSSPCAGNWDLRGRSPSEQKQVGGQVVTWGSCPGHTRGRAVSREIESLRCFH